MTTPHPDSPAQPATSSPSSTRSPLVDHHVHGAFRASPSRTAYGNALNEADTDPLPAGVDPFDSQVGFAIRAWCAPVLGLEQTREPRRLLGPARAARARTRSTVASSRRRGVSHWLVDTGHRADDLLSRRGARHRRAEPPPTRSCASSPSPSSSPPQGIEPTRYAADFRALLAHRARGAVAVKSVLAYRAGFDVDLSRPSDAEVARHAAAWARDVASTGSARLTDARLIAFGLHAAVQAGLPLQLHVGLGDRDLDLRRSDPLLLTDFLRLPEVREVPVLLLHCYPYEREAGYLAQAFRNVHLDVGLSVNFVGARSTALVARSLELAPFDKVLYSSDALRPVRPALPRCAALAHRDGPGRGRLRRRRGVVDARRPPRHADDRPRQRPARLRPTSQQLHRPIPLAQRPAAVSCSMEAGLAGRPSCPGAQRRIDGSWAFCEERSSQISPM